MSAPNPCGQPLRCRRCSTCATCSVLCRCRSFCTGKLFRRCSTCTTCSVLCRCRSYCPGTLFLSEQNCNMSNTSNIVGTEEVGRKGSVHSFLTIYYTSALVSSRDTRDTRGLLSLWSECLFTQRRKVAETYPLCDARLSRSARRSFASLQKSRQNHRFYV